MRGPLGRIDLGVFAVDHVVAGLAGLAIWIVTRPLPSLQCPVRGVWSEESPERR